MNNICEENVIKYFDKNMGKYIIIDRKTGFSNYQSIEENHRQKQKQFFRQLTESHAINEIKTKTTTVPKNENMNEEINQKFDYNNQYKSSVDECSEEQLVVSTQNQTNIKTNNTLLEGFALMSDMKINSSVKLEKCLLLNETLRVIGQMDHKFIVCLAVDRKLMLAFDQHAVHERIRYETLLNQVYDKNRCVKTVPVLPPIDITLEFHQLKTLFDSYETQLKTFVGIQLKRRALNLSPNNSYCVTQIPDCLSDSLDMDSIKEIISEAIIIIADKINQNQELNAIRLSPKLLERLQTKACRGAIRFGDSLKRRDCLKLINSLSKCKSPFRCAHGRSLVAPLAYLPKQHK